MVIELRKNGLPCVAQHGIVVYYEGEEVGYYAADILVCGSVIVELKAAIALAEEHVAQLLNYLKATKYEVGLLLNFGPKPTFKRKVYSNEFK